MKKFWKILSISLFCVSLSGTACSGGDSDEGTPKSISDSDNNSNGGTGSTTSDPLSQLKSNITSHTQEILKALKENGITPKWVQVGNETTNGMLWPTGRLWDDKGDLTDGWKNYTSLSNAGYEAVKSVFPSASVIIHIDNAYEDRSWWFTKFKNNGGKMDMIGLSHYPQGNSAKTWKEMNDLAITHIDQWAKSYGVPVMVCEVGVNQSTVSTGNEIITDFVTRAQAVSNCKGIFYWEPEVYGSWKPTYYSTLGWNAYDKGAFTSAGQPSAILDAFKSASSSLVKGADISWVTEMEDQGKSFYNTSGVKTDCFQLMKETGMNAIRLRVWVNPEKAYGSYCNKADVVAKALRAKAQGLDLLIDFHYSDFFADPSRQTKPSNW